ncbi:hypothetical protein FB45DRAFT_711945, partial [Roridomyces roridus]
AASRPPLAGYLFVCPPEHFKSGRGFFAWPECPWFWSLDPSGISPLTPQTAQRFGFPEVKQRREVWGRRWDTSVYEGLRRLHAANGFDPDSQDIAKHLGFTLMEVAG